MNKKGVVSNVLWKLGERLSAQIVTLIVSIVLARLLDPSHYGLIVIVNIFITLANVLVVDGFGSALIQKIDVDDLDYSSVLIFNIAFSLILYMLLFFISPYIANFYGDGFELLSPVLRVLGIRIIFSGINSVQQAYVARQMIFRKFFLATLLGTIISAIVGIIMAYKGYGVWSLVAQYLVNTTVDTFVLMISLKWWPKLRFSFLRLKRLLKFGWKILGASILVNGFVELRAFLIGKIYSEEDLAFYDKGKQFPSLIGTNINSSISAVLFAKISSEQNDINKVKEITRKSIRLSSFLFFPMMVGFAAVSKAFVSVVLTDKWLPCVSFLQLFCLIYLFQPVNNANMQAIKAVGRSDVFMKLEIIKKIIELITLLLTVWISVEAIVIGMAITTNLFVFINAFPNKKIINYPFKEQMRDIASPLFMSLIMFILVATINLFHMTTWLLLLSQVIVGIAVYSIIALITKNKEMHLLKSYVKSIFHKKSNCAENINEEK